MAVQPKRYAVKVVWADGREEYVCEGISDQPGVFPNKVRAKELADGFEMAFDEGEIQSINVVRAPARRRAA